MSVLKPHPKIFAHRGASIYAPENTLAAFELAVEQMADAIELDAKRCASGEIIVFHDQTIDRTTNGSGKVLEMPFDMLKQLDAGSWFNNQFKGEAIPTLGDVFEAVGKKIIINVELTNYATPRDDLPEKVVDLVIKHGLQKSVLFSSFNPLALRKAHKLLPDIPLGLLALPGLSGAWARNCPGIFLTHQSLHPEVGDTTAKLIERQQKKGREVIVWTVNSADKMRQLFKWNVNGIFTDDPLLAQDIRKQTNR
jgi:glycerophosphoryl diester phosphodiesterase